MEKKIELVKEFKYLGFTWTNRLSLKSTVEKCIGNIQRSLGKLRWLKTGRSMSFKLLRQCFFAYTFTHFTWIFPFFPLLAQTQQQILQQKFRVDLRLVYRCPFVSAQNLYSFIAEHSLEFYVKNYIQRRLTLSGPAYFEKKLNIQIFQLFENDLFLSNVLKSEHEKAFKV